MLSQKYERALNSHKLCSICSYELLDEQHNWKVTSVSKYGCQSQTLNVWMKPYYCQNTVKLISTNCLTSQSFLLFLCFTSQSSWQSHRMSAISCGHPRPNQISRDFGGNNHIVILLAFYHHSLFTFSVSQRLPAGVWVLMSVLCTCLTDFGNKHIFFSSFLSVERPLWIIPAPSAQISFGVNHLPSLLHLSITHACRLEQLIKQLL